MRLSGRPALRHLKRGVLCALLVVGLVLLPSVPRWLVLAAIDEYRSQISPVKGYHCAYARLHGGLTCSAYGRKVIREEGLLRGWARLRRRFRDCEEAGRALALEKVEKSVFLAFPSPAVWAETCSLMFPVHSRGKI
jgi:putative component of membrane protein insertase Oxa1/YidC/SpoIIIJ protein YidD